MGYPDDQLNQIYDKTDGRCHLCGMKLSFQNYGTVGAKAPWEVDHSQPRARGGGNHMRNLLPACVSCNRSKQDGDNGTVRAAHGRTRMPKSRSKRERDTNRRVATGAGVGGVLGGLVGGPVGAVVGAALGGLIGSHDDDEE